ncbi:MAG: hypothetical protein ACFFCQ_10760 [Promethearchaeota archaeon]
MFRTPKKSKNKRIRELGKEILGDPLIDEGLTYDEIGQLCNCTKSNVLYFIKKHKRNGHTIITRTHGQTQRFKWLRSLPTDLQDKKYVEQLYLHEHKSSNQIGEIYGVDGRQIRKLLNHFKIETRTIKDAMKLHVSNSVPMDEYTFQVTDGALLSDGYLQPTKTGMARLRVGQSSIHSDYPYYLANIYNLKGLTAKVIESPRIEIRPEFGGPTIYTYILMYTHATNELGEQRLRWYPDGMKRVPENIRLTSYSCLHWYLGDGSVDFNRYGYPSSLELCTNLFPQKDIEFLCKYLRYILKVKKRSIFIRFKKNHPVIRFHQRSAVKFLQYIGWTSPLPCFSKKFVS